MANPASTISCTARAVPIDGRTIIQLPDDASAALPSRGQVAVEAYANRHEFTTVVEPDGRKGHWLDVGDDLADAANIKPGDEVELRLQVRKEWPEPGVPEDLKTALDRAPDLAETWADITPMARWEWVRWVGATKNPQTRSRRVEVAIEKLRSGKRRPCCFDLSSCTEPDLAKNGKLIEPEWA